MRNDDFFLYTTEAFLTPKLETVVAPLSRQPATAVIVRYYTTIQKKKNYNLKELPAQAHQPPFKNNQLWSKPVKLKRKHVSQRQL